MKQTYRVSFFKQLTDSYGHSVDAWQGCVEVRAPDRERAVAEARHRFAELKDVGVWSLRADYEEVELLAGRRRGVRQPSRAPSGNVQPTLGA